LLSRDQEVRTSPQKPGRDADTSSIFSEASGAAGLARMIWGKRSNQLAAKGNPRQPKAAPKAANQSQSASIGMPPADGVSPRDRIVRDLVDMIKDTPIQATGDVSPEMVEKLRSIVSKAKQLESTLEPREVQPPAQIGTAPVKPGNRQEKSSPWTGQKDLPSIAPDSEDFAVSLLKTLTESADNAARRQAKASDFKNSALPIIPEHLKPRPPATSDSTSPPSLNASNDGQSEGPSSLKPSSFEKEAGGALDSYYLRFGGPDHWVKIRCPQLRLEPTICTLEYSRSETGIWIYAGTSPRYTAPSTDDSVESEQSIEAGTSSEATRRGSAQSLPSQPTYRHRYDLDARPIPAVLIPRLEGPEISPDEPYSILFTEKQDFGRARADRSSKLCADLQYIFSHKEDRDEFRAVLFGKKLLASVMFKDIATDTTACERHVISLWYNERGKCQTITFPTSTHGKDRRPVAEVEYEVWGMNKPKHSEKVEKPLVLHVKPLHHHGSPEPQPKRVNTLLSTFSGRSKTDAPVPDGQRCVVHFRDITDKEKFLRKLRPLQPV